MEEQGEKAFYTILCCRRRHKGTDSQTREVEAQAAEARVGPVQLVRLIRINSGLVRYFFPKNKASSLTMGFVITGCSL